MLEALAGGRGIVSSQAITLHSAGGTFLADSGTSSILSGPIAGAGSLIKNGPGLLALTGPNNYSGGTTLNGGILAADSDGNLGTGALIFNGGTLEALADGGGIGSKKAMILNSGGGTFLADVRTSSILNGPINGVGSLTKEGPGTLFLTGANTYRGGTTLDDGILTVLGAQALGVGNLVLNGDYRITDHLAIGLMGEYAHTWTDLQPAGHIDVDSGRGGLYATWYDHGIYLNGGIFGGHNTYATSRSNVGGLSAGSTAGEEWSTFIGARIRCSLWGSDRGSGCLASI